MNCYYHSNHSAVAVCKNCLRGLCEQCLTEMEQGIACKGKCEERVKQMNDLFSMQLSAFQKTRKVFKRNTIVLSLLALIFLIGGIIFIKVLDPTMGIIYIALGLVMGLGAVFSFFNKKQFEKKV